LLIDDPSIGINLFDRGPRQCAPFYPGDASTERFVIRVVNVIEDGVIRLILRFEFTQQDRLKEPGGVPEVPLGRAHVVARLNDIIFSLKWSADVFSPSPDF